MLDTYSPADVARITGASKPAIRSYTHTYRRYFSTEATPEFGQSRRYTADDLRLIMFIRQKTITENMSHDATLAALAAGDLDQFAWAPPEPQVQPQAQAAQGEPESLALVPAERLLAVQSLLQDAQRREQAALDQVAALQAQVQALAADLGRAQGELAGVLRSQRKAPQWWINLFGGRG